jgi:hypothetical protein
MSAGDLIDRLVRAKAHLDRARELIGAAGAELHQARTLIQAALQGVSDPSAVAMVDRGSQMLDRVGVGVAQSVAKVEEIITRVRGLGGPGN